MEKRYSCRPEQPEKASLHSESHCVVPLFFVVVVAVVVFVLLPVILCCFVRIPRPFPFRTTFLAARLGDLQFLARISGHSHQESLKPSYKCGYNVVILVLSHLVTVFVDPFKHL